MIIAWLKGLLVTRFWRVVGVTAGVAMTVALLALLGAFVHQSTVTMTTRSLAAVPIDWQVELVPGASIDNISKAAAQASPIAHQEVVGYAKVDGFQYSVPGGTTQATGAGKVVGVQPDYFSIFPNSFRLLAGKMSGALLLQQTAANLHAGPGDTITLHRPGLADAQVTIAGVIDLKSADTFFQAVGVPPGAKPQAPPDNAILMPLAEWHQLFDPQASVRPDSVRTQLHLVLDHSVFPSDPASAYTNVLARGHNLEARVAGSAVLGNNLAAKLDATRADALYAYVLFLFLGAPGIILAALLTIAIAAAGAGRRAHDQALLRVRGAPLSTLMLMSGLEALATGIAGGLLGLVVAAIAARTLLGLPAIGTPGLVWFLISAIAGVLFALMVVLYPAWRTARSTSIMASRQAIGAPTAPIWRRLYLDILCLGLAGFVFWRTAASGYQVVLAPEGVAAISVDYSVFLAPFLVWIGGGLLTLRLADLVLGKGRSVLAFVLAPAGAIADLVGASISRQRRRIAIGIVLTTLAFAFAASTAIFNTTFQGQSRVDAELTNGSDVTITGTTAAPAGSLLKQLAAIPGVSAAQPMQHRYAYVGTDLQDIYGIDPQKIGTATSMANAYFANHDAKATLAALARTPSAVLVSDETVKDFQLSKGDTINLRLQGADQQYHVVPFTFAGIVREFPTAPRDSFLIANASYIAKVTGVPAQEVVLMKVSGNLAAVKAAAIKATSSLSGVNVTSLADASHIIGSSLTAVDLGGLTRLELSFAVLMAAAATGLVLALGFADRRRSFAIMVAMGAKPKTLAAFIWSEAGIVLVAGAAIGLGLGTLVAQILVLVLQGVFDPPPETLAVPWVYLALLAGAAIIASGLASSNALRETQIDPAERIRELQ